MIVIGHRGAQGYEPENTIRSFERAIEQNVDMIEFDVHMSKDGEVVVIHDDTLERTTNGTGLVIDQTLSELKELDAGNGEKIPTLNEVLEMVNRRVRVNIEIKGPGTGVAVADMIEKWVEEKSWQYSDFLVSSFDHHEAKAFREKNSETEVGLIMQAIPLDYAAFSETVPSTVVILSKKAISQAFVDDAHKRGKKVYLWDINTKEEMKRFGVLGIDGAISNKPDLIR